MKKLLNTLYINTQEAYVHKERETVVVKRGDDKLGQFPALSLDGIMCFGQVSVSPFLMGFCVERDIGLNFFTEYGKFLAQVVGAPKGNVLLRRKQYRVADSAETVELARLFVAGKIANARSVLMRVLRNHGDHEAMARAVRSLQSSLGQTQVARNLGELLGVEGFAADTYFSVFQALIRQSDFQFNGRIRRPPTDAVNALLSFAYTLLASECASALSGVGLDPFVGFYHQDRPGRKSLALDLMEEFRAPLADRFVLTLINRQEIKVDDFVTEASGAVRLKDAPRKAFLQAWQTRKSESIIHPYLDEKAPIGLLPHLQAQLLARHLRGDLQHYPPYRLK